MANVLKKVMKLISDKEEFLKQGASLLIYHADKEDKVLLIQRNNRHLYDHWSVPGGGRDDGESFETCALREASEEICGGRDTLNLLEPLIKFEGDCPKWITFWLIPAFFTRKIGWKVCVLNLTEMVSTSLFEMNYEAKNLDWFRVDQLPSPIDPTTKASIYLYRCFFKRFGRKTKIVP